MPAHGSRSRTGTRPVPAHGSRSRTDTRPVPTHGSRNHTDTRPVPDHGSRPTSQRAIIVIVPVAPRVLLEDVLLIHAHCLRSKIDRRVHPCLGHRLVASAPGRFCTQYTMRFLMPRGDGAVRAECHIDIVSFLHAEPEDEGRSQQVLITLAANQGDLVITAQRLHTVM
jgi:hypothetical protein